MKTAFALTAALVAGLATFQPAPAQARGEWVAGAIIGAAGAAIIGSAIANSHPRHVYVVDRRCWRERRAVYNRFGDYLGTRLVRVCN